MADRQWSYRRVGLVAGVAVICLITIVYIGLEWSVENFGHPDHQQAVSGEKPSSPKVATGEGLKSLELCSIEIRSWKLREACKSLPDPKRLGFPKYLMVDSTHKVLFCFLQKAGSSTMKRFFVSLNPKFNSNSSHTWSVMTNAGYKLIGAFEDTDRERLLKEYTKAVVVRHPFDRLRSAYYDKFVYNTNFVQNFIHTIAIRKYRENKTDTSTTMTFEEFIKYILDTSWVHQPDKHWAPYFGTSRPCEMNYDYILRLETIERDLDIFIEEVLKMPDDNLFRGVENHGRYTKESRVSLDKYLPEFASVSAGDMARLQVMYGKDFEVFGYTWGSNTTGHCSIQAGKDFCC